MGKSTNDLVTKISLQKQEFDKGIQDLQRQLNEVQRRVQRTSDNSKESLKGLSNYISPIGGMVAGAFAATALVEFGSEATKLAVQAEGVETAFKRLDNPTLLDSLRKATKNTVDDLTLMKLAVQANNFQIPLSQLGSLLQFAQQRAKDTGQSVDYLVDSIITGIGRKSPLILDNLGISAVALKEKMKGIAAEAATVGDVAKAVGQIASESLQGIGNQADTAGEKMGKFSAWWTNLKTKIGEIIPAYMEFFDNISKRSNMSQEELDNQKAIEISVQRYSNELSAAVAKYGTASEKLRMLNSQWQAIFAAIQELDKQGITDTPQVEKYNKELAITRNLISEIENNEKNLAKQQQQKKEQQKAAAAEQQKEAAKYLTIKEIKEKINNINTQLEDSKNANLTAKLLDDLRILNEMLEVNTDKLNKLKAAAGVPVKAELSAERQKFLEDNKNLKPIESQGLVKSNLPQGKLKDLYVEPTISTETIDNVQRLAEVNYLLSDSYNDVANNVGSLGAGMVSISGAMVRASQQGISSLKDLANVAISTAREIVQAEIAKAITASISTTLLKSGVPFPFNVALAAAAAAGTNILINSVVPKFAQGAVVNGATYAMIGEAGPEAILNKMQLGSLVNNIKSNNDSGEVEFKIHGDYLVGILQRSAKKSNSIR